MLKKIKQVLEMIKFSHSIFALPFALAALFFASEGLPSLKNLSLIIICMVSARNTAMAFNRWLDKDIDAQNPRTATRHLPSGTLKSSFVMAFIVANAALFIVTTSFLNPLAFQLSPVALAIICFYSLTKRFTHYTQLFLGISLGISPPAVWIAVTGEISLFSLLLGLAVLFWVAGFDLIYATQDYQHDKTHGIKSLVAKLGISKGLTLSRLLHLLASLTFLSIGILFELHLVYFITIAIVSGFLVYEHRLISPQDLSKVNAAFFTMNGYVGLFFLAGSMLEVLIY